MRKPGSPAKNETASRRASISLGSGQGRRQPLGEQAAAWRGDGLVDRRQQRPFPRARQGSREFEIGSRRGIDVHPRVAREPAWQVQGRTRGKLGALDIENRDGGGGDLGAGQGAQSLQGGEPEIILDAARRAFALSRLAAKRRYGQLRLPREPCEAWHREKRLRGDDFGRLKAGDLGLEGRLAGSGDDKGPRRNIDARKPKDVVRRSAARDGEQTIGADGIEQKLLGDGAGRHQAHHLAADHGFAPALARLGRVLDLLADGDAVALADQPVQIILGALDRHAAHGDIHALMLAALRQDNGERAGGDLGVFKKQFVEIAHAVEEERARIRRLDRVILRHHRRDFGAIRAAPRGLAGGLRKAAVKRGWSAGAAFEHGPS